MKWSEDEDDEHWTTYLDKAKNAVQEEWYNYKFLDIGGSNTEAVQVETGAGGANNIVMRLKIAKTTWMMKIILIPFIVNKGNILTAARTRIST